MKILHPSPTSADIDSPIRLLRFVRSLFREITRVHLPAYLEVAVLSTALGSGTSNDVNPDKYGTIIYSATAGAATITGFSGGVDGRRLRIISDNASTSNITVSTGGGSSTGNNIVSRTGSAVLSANSVCDLEYDATYGYWRIVNTII